MSVDSSFYFHLSSSPRSHCGLFFFVASRNFALSQTQESIGTTEDLTKAQFKDLAMKTFLQSGMKPLPDPRDLDAAFYVADLDHNGKSALLTSSFQ
jgi:hypothetical protein